MKGLSVRTKLVLWYTTMLLVFLVVLAVLVYVSMSKLLLKSERELIMAHADQVHEILEIQGESVSVSDFDKLYRIISSGTLVAVFDRHGDVINAGSMPSAILNLPVQYGEIRKEKAGDGYWIVYDRPIYYGHAGGEIAGWIRCARPMSLMWSSLEKLRLVILIVLPVIIVIAIIGGLFLTSKVLSPIKKIAATAKAIRDGDMSKRIEIENPDDEIGKLSRMFNDMLDRLEDTFSRERQFTSAASHELRTPVTVISATAEEALLGEKSKDEYRGALRAILRESKEMAELISQLLVLTRGDEKRYRLELERINICEIAESVVEEFREMAEEKELSIKFKGESDVWVMADQTLVTRLLINLVDNAIKYNKKGGYVMVKVSEYERGKAVIVVEDRGIGIPEEELSHIFDRFYRGKSARGKKGVGLGLSMAEWITQVHGWKINVTSTPDEGTTFVVEIPGKEDW